MRAQDGAGAILLNTNKCNKTMRYFKESEWRDEVEYIDREEHVPEPLKVLSNSINITRATTRGAVLYFYFSLPKDYQAECDNIFSARRRLKTIRQERRRQTIIKWRRAIKAKIYRWQLQCEYKRITKHDKPSNTIEQ